MADAASVTTFVMENRLPWPDDGAPREPEGPFDAGIIHDGAMRWKCSVCRISALGAMLSGEVVIAPGEDVAIELANGQRRAATVDWVRGGEAGIIFKQPVDMLALINRNLVSQSTERRTMPRIELRSRLYLKWGVNTALAILRNISAKGLQVEGEQLPPRGTFISVFVDGLNMPPGEVVWQKGNLAGIELLEDVSWSSIIPWIREMGRRAV